MALARTLARPFWSCNACRRSYLRAFTTTTANELPRKVLRRSPLQRAFPAPEDETTFPVFEADMAEALLQTETPLKKHSEQEVSINGKEREERLSSKKRSKRVQDDTLSIPSELLEEEEAASETPRRRYESSERHQPFQSQYQPQEEAPQKPMSNLPWYLQMQERPTSTEIEGPMAERQKIPDLPSHPPPALQALLTHLSIEIGLDYLKILDLRALDPPPALGANLIMIVGTARSEKHLGVSAGRFCRHLRAEHGLQPYADGVLGRNELKIKQRRKKKKATALANAGVATAPEDFDDGIRTGWVCVRAGELDPADDAPEPVRNESIIGFGEETNKISLVVQMFTEEKRADVDLEGLWGGLLERNLRKQKYIKDPATMIVEEGGLKEVPDEDDEQLTKEELRARKRFKLAQTTMFEEHVGETTWSPEEARAT